MMTVNNKVVILMVFLVASLKKEAEAGALVKRAADSPMGSITDLFWNRVSNVVTGALHLVGSIIPLRGMATVAKDMGWPFADFVLEALTPTKSTGHLATALHSTISDTGGKSQRRSDQTPVPEQPREGQFYVSFREEMSSAVGAAMGNDQCKKRLACLGGRHLAHINGASSIALLLSSAASYLPDNFKEPLSTLQDSIMYSHDCDQYAC